MQRWLIPFSFVFFSCLLILAHSQRILFPFLEDDLLWFIPTLYHHAQINSFWEVIARFAHSDEMTFLNTFHLLIFQKFFGFNLSPYSLFSLFIHSVNSVLFYQFLQRFIGWKQQRSLATALLFFCFYGHFHATIWPMALHHLLTLTAFFSFYLFFARIERKTFAQRGSSFLWMILFCFLAGFLRISVLVIPFTFLLFHLYRAVNFEKFKLLFQRYFPCLFLLTWYQVFIYLIDRHGNVLDSIMPPIILDFGNQLNLFTILIAALITFIFYALGFLFAAVLFKLTTYARQRIFYLLLVSIAILLTGLIVIALNCLLGGFWAQDLLSGFDRWVHWQYPQNIFILGLLFITSLLMGLSWFRESEKNHHLTLILLMSIFSLPLLFHQFNEIPIRYMIYVSPLFVMLFVLSMEKVCRASYKIIAPLVVILCCWNCWNIFVHSELMWIRNMNWMYPDYKAAEASAEYIRNKENSEITFCYSPDHLLPFQDHMVDTFLTNLQLPLQKPLRVLFAAAEVDKVELLDQKFCDVDLFQEREFIYYDQEDRLVSSLYGFVDPFEREVATINLLLTTDDIDHVITHLKVALELKPFLLRNKRILSQYQNHLFELLTSHFHRDDKLNWSEKIMLTEMQDYAWIQFLWNSLVREEYDRETIVRFLPQDLLGAYLTRYEMDSAVQEKLENAYEAYQQPQSTHQILTYDNYHVLYDRKYYLAVPNDVKDFHFSLFKQKFYSDQVHSNQPVYILDEIDQVHQMQTIESNGLMTIESYKGYQIKWVEQKVQVSKEGKLILTTTSPALARNAIDFYER